MGILHIVGVAPQRVCLFSQHHCITINKFHHLNCSLCFFPFFPPFVIFFCLIISSLLWLPNTFFNNRISIILPVHFHFFPLDVISRPINSRMLLYKHWLNELDIWVTALSHHLPKRYCPALLGYWALLGCSMFQKIKLTLNWQNICS